MGSYVQANRPLVVTTPLGADALLLVGVSGHEAISQLFHFHLDLLAPVAKPAALDKLVGQPVTVTLALAGNKKRFFNGICCRAAEGESDSNFTTYRLEMVPKFWLLTRRAQSRIFQQVAVPDILKKVLDGLDVDWQLSRDFQPRDYCVQYRETDFAFASRLMEEEGIYYFFKHADGAHKMVVTNNPTDHPDVAAPTTITFEKVIGAHRDEDRVHTWQKVQELRSGKVTLWDHCFELPHQHLDANKTIQSSVQAGKATHNLNVGGNGQLELYDYPGGYAQRFDGIAPGGSPRPAELDKISKDNKRTVEIRMQEEAMPSVEAQGTGNCGQFSAGHKFALKGHPAADGAYLLKGVSHESRFDGYRSGGTGDFFYRNSFVCMPAAMPYRPPRVTPRPFVHGTQTAVVVGPKGEEIFTDKYGRIKVQFHWDREGKNDGGSSCWVRVGTPWAGKHWGMIHIPRMGHEVIVGFEEGDPDRPIVLGSVYNSDMMPPWDLPANQTQSGIQTRSSLGGSPANHNQIRFEDKKGSEQLHIHAEKNQDIEVENDETHWVGHDRKKTVDHDETVHVKHDRTETVDNNETITIGVNRTEKVGKNETITVGVDRKERVGSNESITVGGKRTEMVRGNEMLLIGGNQTEVVKKNDVNVVVGNRVEAVKKNETIVIGGNRTESVKKTEKISVGGDRKESVKKNETVEVTKDRKHKVGKNDTLDVGKVLKITAGDEIVIKTGQSSITMKKDGTIVIKGKKITVEAMQKIQEKAMQIASEASTKHETKGAMVNAEASGIYTLKGALVKIN